MQVVRKITVKEVNGAKPAPFAESDANGTKRHIMCVVGRAAEAKDSVSILPNGDESPYLRLKGKFAAWKGEIGEGEEYRAGAAILPNVAADFLAGELSGEEVQSVDFAFRIGVKKDDKAATSYVYYCEPIIQEAEDSDPLIALAKKAQETQKALAAPAAKGKGA